MRISFLDLANVFAHIASHEAYVVTRIDGVQKWVSTVEGIDLTMWFDNRRDRWILSTPEAALAFTFEMKISHDHASALRDGMVRFGKSWGNVFDCVYWGGEERIAALLVMLKIMVPSLYTDDHTYAEFIESTSHPYVDRDQAPDH
ncbi:MAG: hypothetical protein EOP83_17205 [Verrucomicrobiaceae bacterium]|nr:MAG: hypothetical protein EOP83_17205 [Verrucomicrobiaceae bacterium]